MKLKITLIFLFITLFAYSQKDTIIGGELFKIGNVEILYKGEYKRVTRTFYNEERTIYIRCVYKATRKEIPKQIIT